GSSAWRSGSTAPGPRPTASAQCSARTIGPAPSTPPSPTTRTDRHRASDVREPLRVARLGALDHVEVRLLHPARDRPGLPRADAAVVDLPHPRDTRRPAAHEHLPRAPHLLARVHV